MTSGVTQVSRGKGKRRRVSTGTLSHISNLSKEGILEFQKPSPGAQASQALYLSVRFVFVARLTITYLP